jgi:hypothetical protein
MINTQDESGYYVIAYIFLGDPSCDQKGATRFDPRNWGSEYIKAKGKSKKVKEKIPERKTKHQFA